MSTFLKLLSAVAGGILLGLFVTWLAVVRSAGMGGDVTNGPWRTSLLTGSAQSGMGHRAMVALHGLFALNRTEAIHYTAVTDSTGRKLDPACRYTIIGRDPPARWWSITAYGKDDFLIPNAGDHYSVSKSSVARSADGSFAATVSKDAAANQIATGSGAFSLTLRLYNPDPKVADDPAHVALPVIRERGCR